MKRTFLFVALFISLAFNVHAQNTRPNSTYNANGRVMSSGYTPELNLLDSFLLNGGIKVIPTGGIIVTTGYFIDTVLRNQLDSIIKLSYYKDGFTGVTVAHGHTYSVPDGVFCFAGYENNGQFSKLNYTDLTGITDIEALFLFGTPPPNVSLNTYKHNAIHHTIVATHDVYLFLISLY